MRAENAQERIADLETSLRRANSNLAVEVERVESLEAQVRRLESIRGDAPFVAWVEARHRREHPKALVVCTDEVCDALTRSRDRWSI